MIRSRSAHSAAACAVVPRTACDHVPRVPYICAGTGLAPATSTPGLGSPCHIAPGLGLGSPFPHLRWDGAHAPHLLRDWVTRQATHKMQDARCDIPIRTCTTSRAHMPSCRAGYRAVRDATLASDRVPCRAVISTLRNQDTVQKWYRLVPGWYRLGTTWQYPTCDESCAIVPSVTRPLAIAYAESPSHADNQSAMRRDRSRLWSPVIPRGMPSCAAWDPTRHGSRARRRCLLEERRQLGLVVLLHAAARLDHHVPVCLFACLFVRFANDGRNAGYDFAVRKHPKLQCRWTCIAHIGMPSWIAPRVLIGYSHRTRRVQRVLAAGQVLLHELERRAVQELHGRQDLVELRLPWQPSSGADVEAGGEPSSAYHGAVAGSDQCMARGVPAAVRACGVHACGRACPALQCGLVGTVARECVADRRTFAQFCTSTTASYDGQPRKATWQWHRALLRKPTKPRGIFAPH